MVFKSIIRILLCFATGLHGAATERSRGPAAIDPARFISVIRGGSSLPDFSIKGITVKEVTSCTKFQIVCIAHHDGKLRAQLLRKIAARTQDPFLFDEIKTAFNNSMSLEKIIESEHVPYLLALFSFDQYGWNCQISSHKQSKHFSPSPCMSCAPKSLYPTLISLHETELCIEKFSDQPYIQQLLQRCATESQAQETLLEEWTGHLQTKKRAGIEIHADLISQALQVREHKESCLIL